MTAARRDRPTSDRDLDVPPSLRARVNEIAALTTAFATEHLDGEYAVLCRRMAATLARLRPTPIERGEARTWAATIVYAVGWVNFLADPSQRPHMTTAELAARAGVGQSTIALRFREVRDALALMPMDPTWTRPSGMMDNPLAWMVLVDGMLVDVRDLPRELQEEALRVGAIPFLPGAEEPADGRAATSWLGGGAVGDDEPDSPSGDVPDSLRDAIAEAEETIARMLEQNPDVDDAELNTALASASDAYNRRPQTELGGLSPLAVQRLVEADWHSPGSSIRVVDTLSLAELAPSDLLHDARVVLELLAEHDAVKATPKGNLPRTFVAAFRERMRAGEAMDERWYATNPPRNEEDLGALHRVRNLLELAGLVKRRAGRFSRTRQGERLTAPERAGQLFARLLRTHFREMNLAWLDRLPDAPGFQYTIGYTFHQFARVGGEWRTAGDLAGTLLLPSVRDEIPPAPYGGDDAALMLETRFLRPLVRLGLAEARANPREPDEMLARASYRRTPLFDRVLAFDLGAAAR
jgi:hypothetical protein